MKGISCTAILILLLHVGYTQSAIFNAEDKKVIIAGHTNLIGSYYHVGSYVKERPLGFIEQSVEIIPGKLKQLRFGVGSGFNLYPGTAVIPFFATIRYVKPINDKWGFSVIQSYGRNIQTGDIGFNSNRYYGDVGALFNFLPKLAMSFGLGYVFNWDRWGGKSLSFTGSLGLYYSFLRK